ncbi:MAG: DUF3971 domain-containing protein [Kiloniellales bacterium]
MIRRTSIVLLELTAALIAGLAILAGIAVWWLSSGPRSVALLTPYIEQALSPEDGRHRVKIDDTVLTWAGWRQPVEVRARGVRIFAVGGDRPLARLPQVEIGLSGPALFRSMVAPTSLEIQRPSIHLTRAPDGHFELGLSDRPGGDETAIQAVIAGLLSPPDKHLPTGYLETVHIGGAQLTVVDKRLNLSWGAPSADIMVSRDELGIRAAINLAVEVDGERAELIGELVYDMKAQAIAFSAEFNNVQPATYSLAAPMLAPLASIRVPLRGKVGARVTAAGVVEGAWFNVVGGSGEVLIPALYEGAVPVRRFRSRGQVGDNLAEWSFQELFLDLGGPTALAQGTVTDSGDTLELEGTMKLSDISAEAMMRLWPADAASDVRKWTARNLTAGTAHRVHVDLAVRAAKDGIRDLSLERLKANLTYSGLNLRYHDDLPPLIGATGTAILLPTRFDFDVDAGDLGGLAVSDGEVNIIGIDRQDQDVETRFVARGELSRLLEILDSPFLDFTDELGIDPDGTEGRVALRLALEFPLSKDLTREQIRRAAAAKMIDVTVDQGPFGLAMSEGELHLEYEGARLESRGPIKMNGIPTEIKWVEDRAPGGEFRTRFTVDAVLSGKDWAAIGAPGLGSRVTGRVPVQIIYTDIDRVDQFLTLAANLRDAKISVPELAWQKAAGVEGAMRFRVELVQDKPTSISDLSIAAGNDLTARGEGVFNSDGTAIARLELSELVYGGVDGVDVKMTVTGRDEGGYEVALTGERFDAEPYLIAEELLIDFPLALTTDLHRVRIDGLRSLANVRATASFDGERWQAIDMMADIVEEGTDVELRLKRAFPGNVEVRLTGPRFNAEPYLNSQGVLNLPIAVSPGPDPPPHSALHWGPWAVTANTAAAVAGLRLQVPRFTYPLTLRANIEELRLDDRRRVTNVGAAARYDGKIWRVIEMCADLVEGSLIELHYRPEADIDRLAGFDVCPDLQNNGPVDLNYHPEGKQQLIVYSNDAGAALRSFSRAEGFKSLQGGELGVIAFADPTDGEDRLRGKLQIRNFKFVDPPIAAQLLSAFSLIGIGDLLASDDMDFKKLLADFSYSDTRIEVDRVFANSLSVAFHAKGHIDLAKNELLVNADVAPFEPLNELLRLFPGKVGRALVGVDKKGIVAIPMRIEGPLDAPTFSPELSLKPLAPGVLRDFVELIGTGPKDLATPTRIKPHGEQEGR